MKDSEETVSKVKEWLSASGIAGSRVKLSHGLNWLSFNATVDEAESLLKTKYHIYEHESGQPHIACDEYSLPSHLSGSIDFVLPSTHFDVKIRRDGDNRLAKRADPDAKDIGNPGSGSLPKQGATLGLSDIITELSDCDEQITPDCLRLLYGLPVNQVANSENSYGSMLYQVARHLLLTDQ